ncbi:MAG: hypothetical protein IPM77_04875 [Crocinitomicaceae bacterium]|nr:hypothetical protein [Crocinitomicaceae bacterium]
MRSAQFIVTTFLLLAISSQSFADTPFETEKIKLNRRSTRPFGFNLYAFGPIGGIGATADIFISPKFAFEAGAGYRDWDLNHAFTAGIRYHFFGKTFLNFTPYTGVYVAFHYNGNDLQNNSVYIPLGLHKIKKNGFCWSAEIAWQRNTFFSNDLTGGFRIGYRFKTKKEEKLIN